MSLYSKLIKAIDITRESGLSGLKDKVIAKIQEYSPAWENQKIIKKYTPTNKELHDLSEIVTHSDYQPKISVLLPVYNPPIEFLVDCVNSVRAQVYKNWELCIADDCSTDPKVVSYLKTLENLDSRIKIKFRNENGHISKSSNSALELVTGEFTALLDHDDLLSKDALAEVTLLLNDHKDADLIYSNEDKIDLKNNRKQPTFKANWSPDYFLSFMYIGHLSIYRTSLIKSVGGFREGYEGSQDYDLALRATELTSKIYHLPKILYHWRMHPESTAVNLNAKPYAFQSAKRALKDALERRGCKNAFLEDTRYPGIYKIDFKDIASSKIHIVTDSTFASLQSSPSLQIHSNLTFHDFIVLLKSNQFSTSEYLLYLDRDTTGISRDYTHEILKVFQRPNVGLVTFKIVQPNGILLSAGTTIVGHQLYYSFFGSSKEAVGYGARIIVPHNVLIVNPLAWAVKVSDLLEYIDEIDTLSSFESLAVFLSLKINKNKKQNLYIPYVTITNNSKDSYYEINASDFKNTEFRDSFNQVRDYFYPIGMACEPADYRVKL
jgi:glycosyltransferase involved in cell wall biosynthesis